MYIPNEAMKFNKFQLVAIPSPAVYFQKVGFKTPLPSQYSGDDFVPEYETKLDNIHRTLNEMREHIDDFKRQMMDQQETPKE